MTNPRQGLTIKAFTDMETLWEQRKAYGLEHLTRSQLFFIYRQGYFQGSMDGSARATEAAIKLFTEKS